MLPSLEEYVPTVLMNGMPMLMGAVAPADYWKSAVITGVLTLASVVAAIPIFDRKSL